MKFANHYFLVINRPAADSLREIANDSAMTMDQSRRLVLGFLKTSTLTEKRNTHDSTQMIVSGKLLGIDVIVKVNLTQNPSPDGTKLMGFICGVYREQDWRIGQSPATRRGTRT